MNKKQSKSQGSNDLKKETLSQVLNLLRTNTQNIFNLESSNFHGFNTYADDNNTSNINNDNIPHNPTDNPLNHSTPIPSTGNNINNSNTSSPNVSPAVTNKREHNILKRRGHKYSKSATSAIDYKAVQEKVKELGLKNNNSELLSIDWGRPRSNSEATTSSVTTTIIDSDSSTTASPASKKKGKREKRTSGKSLAPVMPFTITAPTRHKGTSLLDVDDEIEKEDSSSVVLVDKRPSSDTLVALPSNASKDARKIKQKATSASNINASAQPSGNGYFDKFMKEFYPYLPSPASAPPPRPYTPSHPVCLLFFFLLYFLYCLIITYEHFLLVLRNK